MDKEPECCSTHLIDGDGTFNAAGLENFINQVKLRECGLSYAVVAIMGPQSSGKSTLLNKLFHTNFKEMDAYSGRSQTTTGIWMARCVGIEPCTIVMDLEGTDGRERGENNTAFEKQSALFALAVSDILLINMWCHDIGREQAANKPLLKTIFQVMLQLFSPRKTTLMFVIRDKTKTPVENLKDVLMEDIQKIWDSITKTKAHKQTPLSAFFRVEVVALSSYEENEEQFKEQMASFRQKFVHSITPGGLAGDRQGVVHASGFSFRARRTWELIKENKDLNLPTHKVMVATVRCEEIANEKYVSFVANEDWIELEGDVQCRLVLGFGKKLSSLIHNCLSSYDEEAAYFEDSVRFAKRKHLQEKLLQLVQPAYQLMLEHIRSGTLDNFKKALDNALSAGQQFAVAAQDCTTGFMRLFDEQCGDAVIKQANWGSPKVRDKFSRDIHSHIVEVQTAKVSELTALYESKLQEALYGPVGAYLKRGADDTWLAIRMLLHREIESTLPEFCVTLSGFQMDALTKEDMILNLKNYGRGVVEARAREEAGQVSVHIKERFTFLFNHDNDHMPRSWTGKEDVRAITKTARSSCLQLLSVLAAIRLDEDTDTIENTLVLTLLDSNEDTIENALVLTLLDSEEDTRTSATLEDPLALSTWNEVPAARTLITPVQCKLAWDQFQRETDYLIAQANRASWEANVHIARSLASRYNFSMPYLCLRGIIKVASWLLMILLIGLGPLMFLLSRFIHGRAMHIGMVASCVLTVIILFQSLFLFRCLSWCLRSHEPMNSSVFP